MKPNEKVNYILEADEEMVHKASLDAHKLKRDKIKKNKRYLFESDDSINQTSSASTAITNIQGMMFGGFHSRFWMLRKHFNSMSKCELNQAAFYSWECLSLQLNHRDVDLVIRDENQMNKLLKFLIRKLRTIDG